ncbi:hypothetical protein DPMN_077192 [Dreissena polymorpha]|uniref:Uncharacterized protein n=1 Tax=Dreissena polymorpha TaxID=45954 RepID=A0A9D3YLH1_DREPO|nr:hypothetical protein DPMN_077192 [Dreissena polymorpha]
MINSNSTGRELSEQTPCSEETRLTAPTIVMYHTDSWMDTTGNKMLMCDFNIFKSTTLFFDELLAIEIGIGVTVTVLVVIIVVIIVLRQRTRHLK